jgi:hypothetical protein
MLLGELARDGAQGLLALLRDLGLAGREGDLALDRDDRVAEAVAAVLDAERIELGVVGDRRGRSRLHAGLGQLRLVLLVRRAQVTVLLLELGAFLAQRAHLVLVLLERLLRGAAREEHDRQAGEGGS